MSTRIIHVRPTLKADLWTKNHLRNHGSEYRLIKTEAARCWHGMLAMFVESTDTGWQGWYPVTFVDEFTPDAS